MHLAPPLMPFQANFGVILPPISLLATIGLSFSILAPIVNAVALMAFGLLWFAYSKLLLIVPFGIAQLA